MIRKIFLPVLVIIFALFLAAETVEQLQQQLASAAGAQRVELLLKLSAEYRYKEPAQVVRYADEAIQVAAAMDFPTGEARGLLLRATGFFQLGKLDQALASYQSGLDKAQTIHLPDVMGGCLNGIAAVEMKRGQVLAALGHFEQALSFLEKAGDKEKLAGIHNNIAIIYYNRGEYDQALDYMFKAQLLYEELGDESGVGVVLNAIGNIYNKLGKHDQALKYFRRVLSIAENTGHKQLKVSCLVNMGEIFARTGAWPEALEQNTRALALARELGNPEYEAVCLNNIGDARREMGDNAAALENYLASMKIFKKMNAKPRIMISYLNIGKLYVRDGRLQKAQEYLIQAFRLAEETEERNFQREAADALFQLYEQLGDYQQALRYQKIHTDLKEQLFSGENIEKIATLQARYETEKKQQQIELLQREREIGELQIKRQRLWMIFISTALILAAVIAFFLYRRYRLKIRTNTELSAAYTKMSQLAKHDELTGLLNRRSAMERMEIEMVRMGRTWRPFSVIMVDVDDFKRINDTLGHECGDRVLRNLAATVRDTLREPDVAARWGGEEFLLMLPETDMDGAVVVAEKIRQCIARSVVEYDGRPVSVTVTMGVNVYDKPNPINECIRGADEALYQGKLNGKNQVVRAIMT
ncbi:MAG: tetratricopeptide repeat protein [Acidobacteria bacterium]|nr:tetratricopeptide repeat protein [Acidobacteriota bacterium]